MKKKLPWNKTRIVAVGGGTGLSTLLSGLKKYTRLLSGIVTVTDDGGSSGTLRKELHVLPPGDIRNCLVALADEEKLLSRLFQYRFPGKGNLSGHSFGNLFLSAMAVVAGGFDRGIIEASKVLAVRGQVLPVTLEKVRLRATLEGGKTVYGETNISRSKKVIRSISLVPVERPLPGPGVLQAFAEADVIVLGPGSLFTSIIPNLLVDGIGEAIACSPAVKVYVCNIMSQPGETTGLDAQGHCRAVEQMLGKNVIDHIFLNKGKIPLQVRKRYAKKNAKPVKNDFRQARKTGRFSKIKEFDFVLRDVFVRHDPDVLARAVLTVV